MKLLKLKKILEKKALHGNDRYVHPETQEAIARSIVYRDVQGKKESLLDRVKSIIQN